MQVFIDLTEDLKRCGINPDFHFMDNEASTALNMKITAMNIKYQLVPPSNLIANNAYRAIQTFKKTLHSRTVKHRQIISYSILGNKNAPGNNQSKITQTIKNPSPPIILYPHIWIILFQKLTVSTTWDKSSNL